MRARGRLVVAAFVVFGVAAADARATLRIENHNDPAGDPTVIAYRLESPTWSGSPFDFELPDADYRSFGVPAGTYTAHALVPEGWQVGDIQCVGPRPEDFAIDVPNARVTVRHGVDDEHICAFTNRRIPRSGESAPAPSPGVAPSPAPAELPKVVLPRRPAVLGVVARRRSAEATVRITRRSVIKGRLLSGSERVLGSARMTRGPGTHVLRVSLTRDAARRLRRRGRSSVMLTLRVAVVARSGATWAFRHRVVVPL
jgi:hypothetical protein